MREAVLLTAEGSLVSRFVLWETVHRTVLLRRRCTGWTGVISVKKFCYVECSVLCGNVFYEQKTNKTENGTTRAICRVASKLPWFGNEIEQNRIARFTLLRSVLVRFRAFWRIKTHAELEQMASASTKAAIDKFNSPKSKRAQQRHGEIKDFTDNFALDFALWSPMFHTLSMMY